MMNGWGFSGGGYGAGFGSSRRFEEQYHCYSVAYADKPQLEVRVQNYRGRRLSLGVLKSACVKLTVLLLLFLSLLLPLL
jgi:hypothetical protein